MLLKNDYFFNVSVIFNATAAMIVSWSILRWSYIKKRSNVNNNTYKAFLCISRFLSKPRIARKGENSHGFYVKIII